MLSFLTLLDCEYEMQQIKRCRTVRVTDGGQADKVAAIGRKGFGLESSHHWSTFPLVSPLMAVAPLLK